MPGSRVESSREGNAWGRFAGRSVFHFVPLAVLLFGLVSSFGCTRPAPTLLPCYGDCDAQGPDAGLADASPPDAEPPPCETAFASCVPSYPDGPLAVPDSADVQEGDVASGAGLLFMAYARFGQEFANIGLIGVDDRGRIQVERKEFEGFNLARVGWNEDLGMGVVVADSLAHWFDAQGRELGRSLSLSPDFTQMNPVVGSTESGFVILAGPMSYDPTLPIPPLWGTIFSGQVDEFHWVELLPSTESWVTPVAGLDASGWTRVVAATDASAGQGMVWTLQGGRFRQLMTLPGPFPQSEYGPDLALAYYQGHAVILWGGYQQNLWLGRDDGLAVDLGMNGSFGSLVVLDGGLVLVSQDPSGAIFLNKLSSSQFGSIEETRQVVPAPSPRSWFLRAKPTPHGIGMVWGGGGSPLEMLELDCCMTE